MFRYCCVAFILLSVSASIALAQATRPSTPTLSPAELYDLHVQAVKFMRASQFDKAKPLLEKVYLQTPAGQRSRALVLNRAIMDLAQRTNVSRGVRDLTAYLTAHTEPDEAAINLLGASLNLMTERSNNAKRSGAWQGGVAVWEQRDAELGKTRPDLHRWGVEWLNDEEFSRIEVVRVRNEREIRDQTERVRIAQITLNSMMQTRNGMSPAIGDGTGPPGANATLKSPLSTPPPTLTPTLNPTVKGPIYTVDELAVMAEQKRMDRQDIPAARQRLADEQAALAKLQETTIRPEWPKRFEPIDPEPAGAVADAGAGATTQAATTAPTALSASATTQPLANDPHSQAVALMRAGEWKKAREILDAIWKDTSPEKRSRALVINRAIVDLTDSRFVIRAVRDLGEYLVKHPEPDEQATNVLAAALNNAAGDPKLKSNPIWQSAWKEWDRRNEQLDQSRPGFRRWGAQWLSDEEFAALRQRQKDQDAAVRQQADVVQADLRRVGAVTQARSVQEFVEGSYFLDDAHTNSIYQTIPRDFMETQHEWIQNLRHYYEVNTTLNQAQGQATRDFERFQQLVAQRERPKWPTRFEPVSPSTEEKR